MATVRGGFETKPDGTIEFGHEVEAIRTKLDKGATTMTKLDKTGLISFVTGGGTTPTSSTIDAKIFEGYEGALDKAKDMFDFGEGTVSKLKPTLDELKVTTKTNETVVDALERAFGGDSKDLKNLKKDHLADLKDLAGKFSDKVEDALAAHKDAYQILGKQQADVYRDLQDAARTAMEAGGADKVAISKRLENAVEALQRYTRDQQNFHERAVDKMKTAVSKFTDNGVSLKRNFDFDLKSTKIFEKGAEATSNTAKTVEHSLEGEARTSSRMPATLGFAAAGAGVGYFVAGDDNKGMGAGIGGLLGGIGGYLFSGRGAKTSLGATHAGTPTSAKMLGQMGEQIASHVRA